MGNKPITDSVASKVLWALEQLRNEGDRPLKWRLSPDAVYAVADDPTFKARDVHHDESGIDEASFLRTIYYHLHHIPVEIDKSLGGNICELDSVNGKQITLDLEEFSLERNRAKRYP